MLNWWRKRTDRGSVLQRHIESYWPEAAYITNDRRLNRMRGFLIRARSHLDKKDISEGFDAFYQAKREYILARKHRQIYYRRSWFGMQLALLLVVFFGILTLGLWWNKNILPIGSLAPILAAMGGGLGGCAAVLIQVIDVDPNSEVVSKWPWFVIKPTLGAALGLVTYFAVITGLNLIATGTKVETFEASVMIGFLAGFFESFSTGILARVANQFSGEKEEGAAEPKSDEGPGGI